MANLYFKYGCMNSGKSLELIRSAYNYKERGMDILVYKPKTDTRSGTEKCIIESRTGAKLEGQWIYPTDNIMVMIHQEIERNNRNISAIFLDEVQFLSTLQVDQLRDVVLTFDIPVLCYGILTDFKTNLFEGSKRLVELAANHMTEIPSICWCGKKSSVNARVINGELVKDGEQVMIGGNETYITLCHKHFREGKLHK